MDWAGVGLAEPARIVARPVEDTQQEHQESCSKEESRDPRQMPHSWKWKLCSLLECHKAKANWWVENHQFPDGRKCPCTITELVLGSAKWEPLWGVVDWITASANIPSEAKLYRAQGTPQPKVTKAPDPPMRMPYRPYPLWILLKFQSTVKSKIPFQRFTLYIIGGQTYSAKGQRGNMLSFAGLTVSVSTTQLCHCTITAAIANM